MNKKIIGMSSCLAGRYVRYDGDMEYQTELIQMLEKTYSVLTFCPEVAIGMTIPRRPIHLRQVNDCIKVVDKQTGLHDYTAELQDYAELIAKRYPDLRAYIFKQHSPSCGVGKTKLHRATGEFSGGYGDGIFAAALKQALPNLLVVSEDRLLTNQEIKLFLQQLTAIN